MMCNTPQNFSHVVALETLLRHVVPEVPEAPHEMALDRIRQSYIEFSRKTLLLTYRQTIDFQTDVHDYELQPPEGYEVYQLLSVNSPGYRPVDYWQGQRRGLWNTNVEVIDNRVLYLERAPSVDTEEGLQILMHVLPNSCCSTIPKSVEVPYGYGIAKGALAGLLRIPNKPWTSPGLARLAEVDFNRTALAAKNLAIGNRKFGSVMPRGRRVV